jgi:CubicO group peptidase (beta-lactamase class C family)
MRSSTFLHSVAITAVLLTNASLARAQSITDHPRVAEALNLVEVWLAAQRDYHDLPGVSAGVVYDQDLIWSEGFGYADVQGRTAAAPSTMYSICSISKLFTSVSVMQLRDMGKFRLDDEVGSILPWFDLEQSYAGSAPVTVEGILTHSAGLPRESDYPYWTDPFDFPTHDAVVTRLSSQETLYPAWKYHQYSNLGLTLAGEIVSEASGQSFGEYIRGHILDPLGMTSTVPEIDDAWGNPQMATGYSATRRDGERKQVKPFAGRGIAPAMGFASTVEDLARFASWQFRLLENGGKELLDANTLREMHRVHWVDPGWETTWGLGFSVSRRDDKTFVRHGGSCPGFRTELLIQPDDEIATIAMINANGTNPGLLARRAYEIVAAAVEAAQDSADQGEPLSAELKKYVGAYDQYPWGGESAVIPWKGGLAAVSLPTDNPLEAMTKLKHIEGDHFRRIRDDESLGEEIVFETDANGNVLRMWQHSNPAERMRR